MVKLHYFRLLLVTATLCNFQGVLGNNVAFELILSNVSYGNDPEQIMDVYLPHQRNQTASKVILLIHGGGWRTGSKESMHTFVLFFNTSFPQHTIVNMNYRLGTVESPAFPKQIEDIAKVIQYVKSRKDKYKIIPEFGLVGVSAGGHLSLLFGYGFDIARDVKVICNMVGPTNLLDPNYTNNTAFGNLFLPLIGNVTFVQNPALYKKISPVYHATSESPKTIGFYGTKDQLIPTTQRVILEDVLDSLGVYNKYYTYEAGHGNWNQDQYSDIAKKLAYFFKYYF